MRHLDEQLQRKQSKFLLPLSYKPQRNQRLPKHTMLFPKHTMPFAKFNQLLSLLLKRLSKIWLHALLFGVSEQKEYRLRQHRQTQNQPREEF
jgi:hypothetical protein